MAASPNNTQITPPRVSIIDERTGAVSREWYRWFYSLYNTLGGGLGIIPVNSGGTGLSTIPTDGQLLIGNGTGYTLDPLGEGSGIAVTNDPGAITLTNTGVLSNVASSGISVSAPTGNVTISNTGVLSNIAGSGISVSSSTGNSTIANTGVLSFAGGSTGLTPATTTTGAVTLAGVLNTVSGGTNLSSYATGDTLYASAANTLSKFTKPSAVAIYTMDSSGVPAWKIPRYGAFYDTTNQTAAAVTPTAITFNSTQISSGIAIGSPTSRITVDTAGLYNIQFSIQFYNTNSANDNTVIWLKVNGSDVADSASWVTVPGKHAGGDGQAILSLNLFYQFTAGQYFQLYWMNTDGHAALESIPLSASPSYPESPSIILTVSDNIKA